MRKRDKQIRRTKRKARQAASGKRKHRQQMASKSGTAFPNYSMDNNLYLMENPFPKEMDVERRKQIIGDTCRSAKSSFDTKLKELSNWFDEFDSCYLLSFYAFYFLLQPEGSTNEIEGDTEHYQYYLEILQAVALSKPRNVDAMPLKEKAKQLELDMIELGKVIQFKGMDVDGNETDDVLKRKFLISRMRNETAVIRNWAYYPQMERITTGIATAIDTEFETKYGLKCGQLAHALITLHKLLEPKIQAHQEAVRKVTNQQRLNEIFDTYEQVFPNVTAISSASRQELYEMFGKDVRNVKYALMVHSDLQLPNLYTFTAEEFAALYGDTTKIEYITRVLDTLSYEFGELHEFNLEHSILGNPVLQKPLIKLDDGGYFCPIVGSVPHFTLQIIESLVADDQPLKKKYETRKAEYCENYVANTLEASFPNAKIRKRIRWKRTDKPGVFETDTLVLISNFALVVEVKSGKVTPQARRGAADRLQKHIQELIIDPSSQANNFIDAARKGLLQINSIDGKNDNLDLSGVSHYLPLAVTNENLGISTNPRAIVEAGLNHGFALGDFAVTMSMADLESLCNMLDFEAMKLHYLVRRRDFNAHIDFIADELDLLGFYLTTGFNMGNEEYARRSRLNLTMASINVDRYFISKIDRPTIPKPKNYLTDHWSTMLHHMATMRPVGWIEASFALLGCAKNDQEKYLKARRKHIIKFTTGKIKESSAYVLFKNGADMRQSVIVAVLYRDLARDDKLNLIGHIFDMDEVKSCKIKLAFGIDVNRLDSPYDIMAITKDSQLIEEPLQVLMY